MAFLKIEDLTYSYPDSLLPALENINITIADSEFVLLLGSSGSGKSTLLRCMANIIPDFYGGELAGQVLLEGINLKQLKARELASRVAMLFQEPEHQLVKHKVENEIAFSLENLNVDREAMLQRVVEVSNALNLAPLLDNNIADLSGGLKQKVALAAAVVRQPELLLLDEPLSQIDHSAAEDLLNVIRLLHEEFGITIIIAEHRWDSLLSLANRVIFLEAGRLVYDGGVQDYLNWARANNTEVMPTIPKLFMANAISKIPVNVKEAKRLLANYNYADSQPLAAVPLIQEKRTSKTALISLNKVSYQYPNKAVGVKKLVHSFNDREITAIIGQNGAGKTSLLKLIAGLIKPSKGEIIKLNQAIKVGYVPQNPDDYLFLPTVIEEVIYNLSTKEEKDNAYKLLELFNLSQYKNTSPKDLSFGQKQLVVLAATLASEPAIICLDEPTRGLDYALKNQLGEILKKLKSNGRAIILVSNDIEFIAEYSDNIMIMSKGEIITKGDKYNILTKATFYAPQISRIFRNINNNILTFEEAYNFLKSSFN